MKRALIGVGLAAAVVLGASSTASAGEQHHKSAGKHDCPHACTPAPPIPAGGWDCQKAHSCHKPRHPHCPRPKPPVTPPSTVTPHKPVVSKPRTPATPVQRRLPAAPAVPQTVSPSLPKTGGFYEQGLYGAAGLMLVGGGLLRAGRGSKWTKA